MNDIAQLVAIVAIGAAGWVHCSWKPSGRRMSVLTFVPGKGYFNGLSV